MPTTKQIDSQRNVNSLSPVLGGNYSNGTLYYGSTGGLWWGSTAYNGALRYLLSYNGSSLYTSGGGNRHYGFYIRCVSEEKTVTDLTYLQDMTGEIADNTLDGTTANSSPTIWSPTALAEKMLRKLLQG